MSKNLTYTNREPAFLQRLKANFGPQDGRNNIQHARPGKSRLRMGDEEEDDGPVVVDERGEVVDLEEMTRGDRHDEAGGVDGEGLKKEDVADDGAVEGSSSGSKQQKVVEIGATKKRKVAKVIGGDDDPKDESKVEKEEKKGAKQARTLISAESNRGEKKENVDKSKKKAKKIKLSFEDPE